MANQQVKTGLGTAVILIFAITAGVFVWMTQKNQNSELPMIVATQKLDKTRETLPDIPNDMSEVENISELGLYISAKKLQADYHVSDISIDIQNPEVNEVMTMSFEIKNTGKTDLFGGGYSISLTDANIIDDQWKTTCDGTKIIAPSESCIVNQRISYSNPGKHTIVVNLDDQQNIAETNEENNSASLELAVVPQVILTYPNGGEILKTGKTYAIKWKKGEKYSSIIEIQLVDTNVQDEPGQIIASSVSTKYGYFNWTISNENELATGPGKHFKIRIMNAETNEIYDESDSVFSIVSGRSGCSDSDGGLDYFQKGTACSGNMCFTDSCQELGQDEDMIMEANCNSSNLPVEHPGLEWKEYTCPDGCQDGACVSSPTNPPLPVQ